MESTAVLDEVTHILCCSWVLGHGAELDDQIGSEVLGLGFTALFPPQVEEGALIIAHDDPCI
jgi:hypothetical protein